jgi:hypothetical protein
MKTLMYQNRGESRAVWNAICRTAARVLVLGVAAASAAGLFGAICGLILGLIEGNPWTCLTVWGLRAAFAGLAAGAIMGAISGIYHVEETAPDPAAARSHPATESRTFLPARPIVALFRSGVRSRN